MSQISTNWFWTFERLVCTLWQTFWHCCCILHLILPAAWTPALKLHVFCTTVLLLHTKHLVFAWIIIIWLFGLGGKIQQNAVIHGVCASVCTIWRCFGTRGSWHWCGVQIVEGHIKVLPVSSVCPVVTLLYNNNNTNNTWTMFMVLSSWHKSLRELSMCNAMLFIWRMQTSARWLQTLRPGQPPWAVSPPVGCYMAYIVHMLSLFIITQPESWYSFYRPTEGGRLSQPRHTACSPI